MAHAEISRQHVAERETERAIWGIKTFLLTLVFVSVLVGLGIYQVWHRYQVYSLGMDLSSETLSYRDGLDHNRKLKLELATLKRVERIRGEAEERLGMRVPAPQDVIEVQ
ncbi:MAG: cell division protein FtsL [Myxococcota bacterium]